MTPRAVHVKGGVASVLTRGNRDEHLVILPPLGMPAAVLDPFVDALLERFRVSVLELPGAGRASEAEPHASTRHLGMEVADVLRELGGRPHLLGTSLGGMIAQWTAIDARGTFDRLVLVSCCARGLDAMFADPVGKLETLARALRPEPARVALAEALVSPEAERRTGAAVASAPRDDTELVGLVAAAVAHDASAHLWEIHASTLVLSGDDDAIVPVTLQDALASAIPRAHRVSIPNAGHAVAIDQPLACARVVQSFLGH